MDVQIQWYPGHMTKTRRQMEADLKLVDLVCEVVDARIPVSSRNPDLGEIAGGKPRLLVLNRIDQADAAMTKAWTAHFQARGLHVLGTDCKSGAGISAFPGAVREVLREQIARYAAKGQTGRALRVMVVGVPNVGKSALINRVAKRKTAKVADRPGVTRAGSGFMWTRDWS